LANGRPLEELLVEWQCDERVKEAGNMPRPTCLQQEGGWHEGQGVHLCHLCHAARLLRALQTGLPPCRARTTRNGGRGQAGYISSFACRAIDSKAGGGDDPSAAGHISRTSSMCLVCQGMFNSSTWVLCVPRKKKKKGLCVMAIPGPSETV
jgi:hypothetical protein